MCFRTTVYIALSMFSTVEMANQYADMVQASVCEQYGDDECMQLVGATCTAPTTATDGTAPTDGTATVTTTSSLLFTIIAFVAFSLL